MNKKLNEMWDNVLNEFEYYHPYIAEKTVDWWPSAQMEITVKTENDDRYIFNWIEKSIKKVYSSRMAEENILEDDWRAEFSCNLIKKMRKLGMSQDTLSEKTGISKETISKYTCGRATPSFYNVDKIARALRCSVSELGNIR